MKIRIVITYIAGITELILPCSCKKYLDAKPSSIYSTVSTINDAQLLMDNSIQMNLSVVNMSEFASDNIYFTQSIYDGYANNTPGNVYIWGQYPFISVPPSNTDWAHTYSAVMAANIALDALDRIKPSSSALLAYNNAKGSALAFRGYYFWKLATTFSKTYREESANTDLGIPLRLNININEVSTRGTIQETYDQIIKDLTEAASLLPEKPGSFYTRPSKSSVNAMLAEVYLSMREYNQAKNYSNASLLLNHELVNYNLLDISSTAPIPTGSNNPEILIYFDPSSIILYPGQVAVDPALYNSYNNNDLRKRFYYNTNTDGTHNFSAPFSLIGCFFTGPTTAEMYLTRAECAARAGDVDSAMEDLNTLLKNRIVNTPSNIFVPLTASSKTEALNLILAERRKELVFRDLRWMDLKRLNAEGANITLTRNLNGKIYTLAPNDNRYAIQLPPDVIQISGMEQNPY